MTAIPTRHMPQRIAELSPFDTISSDEYVPSGWPCLVESVCREEPQEGETAYGCVDWYQYAGHVAPTGKDSSPK